MCGGGVLLVSLAMHADYRDAILLDSLYGSFFVFVAFQFMK